MLGHCSLKMAFGPIALEKFPQFLFLKHIIFLKSMIAQIPLKK